MQTQGSKRHPMTANAITLRLNEFSIVLDSSESLVTGAKKGEGESTIGCRTVQISGIIFHTQVNISVLIDGLSGQFFPTLPVAVSHLISVLALVPDSPLKPPPAADAKGGFIHATVTEAQRQLIVIGSFVCTNSQTVLKLINDNLLIPSIEVTFNYVSDKFTGLLRISLKVVASISPPVINWVDQFRNHARVFDFSNVLEAVPVVASDPQPSPSKIAFQINVITQKIEICFGCQPRRTDISCIVGFASLRLILVSENKAANLTIMQIFFRTQNIFATQTQIDRAARLFEFVIPQIDAIISSEVIGVLVHAIETSFSSDKIEEISLFNDVWIQPLIKTLANERPLLVEPAAASASPPSKTKVEVLLGSIHLSFKYAIGAGDLELLL
jgi:hypothetical protein